MPTTTLGVIGLAALLGAAVADPAGAGAKPTGKYRMWVTKTYGDDHFCLTELELFDENEAPLDATFVSMTSCYGCDKCDGCTHKYGNPAALFDKEATSDDPAAWICTAPGTFVDGVGQQEVVFTSTGRPASYVLQRPSVNGGWVTKDYSLEEELEGGVWQLLDNVVDAVKRPDQKRVLTMAPVRVVQTVEVHTAWSYDNVDSWVADYPTCGGLQQSPIDLDLMSNMATKGDTKLPYDYKPMAARALANTGTTLQVGGNFGSLNLTDGVYDVVNFHFHFPQEHRIGGEDHVAIGELQIIHQKRGASGSDGLAIVSIMLHLPAERDQLVSEEKFFIDMGMLAIPAPQEYSQPLATPIDLNGLKEQLSGNFWQYTGSLATPPCTEGVQWFIMEKPAHISGVVVKQFKSVFPDPSNARPLQSANGRVVSVNTLPGAAAASS